MIEAKYLFDKFYFGPFNDKRVAALHINNKRRNLFFTLTDLTGNVLGTISGGTVMPRRKKRFSPQVVELMMRKLILDAKFYRIVQLRLFLKMPNKRVWFSVVRCLKLSGIRVLMIVEFRPVPHNGCRAKKVRRL